VAATTKINRKDFGLTWNAALEAGELMVGDDVSITLDLEFVKQAQARRSRLEGRTAARAQHQGMFWRRTRRKLWKSAFIRSPISSRSPKRAFR
jgi:hypothetical protein